MFSSPSGNPVTFPKISDFFSGTFIYNMINHVSRHTETLSQCFLSDESGRDFHATYRLFLENLPQLGMKTSPRKTKKKKSSKADREDRGECESVRGADGEDTNESGQSESEHVFVDVENRFAALMVSAR